MKNSLPVVRSDGQRQIMSLKAEVAFYQDTEKEYRMVDEEIRVLMNDGERIIEENTEAVIEAAQTLLGQKYGLSFQVMTIGNRLDTDTADLTVIAEDDPDRCFKAVVNQDLQNCSDNYVRRCVGCKLGSELLEGMKKNGKEVACAVKLLADDDGEETETELTAEEYAERYHLSGILIYMIAPSAKTGKAPTENEMKVACDALCNHYRVPVVLWRYAIADHYEACLKGFLHNPDIKTGYFEFFEQEDVFSYAAKADVL